MQRKESAGTRTKTHELGGKVAAMGASVKGGVLCLRG